MTRIVLASSRCRDAGVIICPLVGRIIPVMLVYINWKYLGLGLYLERRVQKCVRRPGPASRRRAGCRNDTLRREGRRNRLLLFMIWIVQAGSLRCYAGVIICPRVAYFAPCVCIVVDWKDFGLGLYLERGVRKRVRCPGPASRRRAGRRNDTFR